MSLGERETLLSVHRALSDEEFESIKFLLEGRVPRGELLPATRPDLCRLLLQRFPGRALHVTAELLRSIPRHDLIQLHRLPGAEEGTPGETLGGTPREMLGGSAGEAPGGTPGGTSCIPPGCGSISPPRPRRLTEKQLLQVAQKLGREWQEVGIRCLGLERSRLEQIQEDEPHNVVMQSFQMLREWLRREREGATAPRLRALLAPACLDPDLFDLLQSFQGD
ncbi:ANK3 protein, partial [Brachypteracias leptosomus]|nr:ANK3 protein [Brachypteracias leptosomus]